MGLRVGINFGNALLATRDGATGQPSGIAVDLARELGRTRGAPVEIVGYTSANLMADDAARDVWDVAFLAADPARATEIAFTAPYLEIEATYLVGAGSPFRTLEDVDRPGVRIAVSDRSAYDLALSRTIRHAQLVRAPSVDASVALFYDQGLDALAGLRPLLATSAEAHDGFVVLDGRFTAVLQAIGAPAGADVTYLHEFVTGAKASGLVARLIGTYGLTGRVTPA